jgi:hypothetical protein
MAFLMASCHFANADVLQSIGSSIVLTTLESWVDSIYHEPESIKNLTSNLEFKINPVCKGTIKKHFQKTTLIPYIYISFSNPGHPNEWCQNHNLKSAKASSAIVGFPAFPVCNPRQATGQFFQKNVSAIKTTNRPCHSMHHLMHCRDSLSFSEQEHFATIHLATQYGRTSEDKILPLSDSFGSSLEKHLESNCRQLA